jgi:hypothetical protein
VRTGLLQQDAFRKSKIIFNDFLLFAGVLLYSTVSPNGAKKNENHTQCL